SEGARLPRSVPEWFRADGRRAVLGPPAPGRALLAAARVARRQTRPRPAEVQPRQRGEGARQEGPVGGLLEGTAATRSRVGGGEGSVGFFFRRSRRGIFPVRFLLCLCSWTIATSSSWGPRPAESSRCG